MLNNKLCDLEQIINKATVQIKQFSFGVCTFGTMPYYLCVCECLANEGMNK